MQSRRPMSSEALSRKLSTSMKAGKVSASVKHLTTEMSGCILPLNEETFHLFQTKHPKPKPCGPDTLIETQTPEVYKIVFNTISQEFIQIAARRLQPN